MTKQRKKTAPELPEPDLSHIHESLRPLAVPISSLHPDPVNPVEHDEQNIEAIKASLQKFGQDQPLVVQKAGMIVRKGNGRLQAAIELGWTYIAAIIVDEDDLTAIERALADNQTARLSKWKDPVLRQVFELLSGRGDGTIIGWTAEQAEAIMGIRTAPTEFPEIDENIKTDHVCPKCGYRFSGGQTVAAAETPAEAPVVMVDDAAGDDQVDDAEPAGEDET